MISGIYLLNNWLEARAFYELTKPALRSHGLRVADVATNLDLTFPFREKGRHLSPTILASVVANEPHDGIALEQKVKESLVSVALACHDKAVAQGWGQCPSGYRGGNGLIVEWDAIADLMADVFMLSKGGLTPAESRQLLTTRGTEAAMVLQVSSYGTAEGASQAFPYVEAQYRALSGAKAWLDAQEKYHKRRTEFIQLQSKRQKS